MDNEELFDNAHVHIETEDEILVVIYKQDLCINLRIAKEIVARRIEVTKSKPYPVLIIDQGVKSIEKPARDYFASREGVSHILASALVLRSIYSVFLGNFLIRITQPPIPVKIFKDIQNAKKWLKQYRL